MMLGSFTLKGALAFFLVAIAASMVYVWMYGVFILKANVDAGMAALLAGFVMLFIKMASDASGYQYNSSSGSEKKDETQAKVAEKLADQVVASTPGVANKVVAWWDILTDAEKSGIQAAEAADARVKMFIGTSKVGRAKPEDLDYLETIGLLTKERVVAIKAA